MAAIKMPATSYGAATATAIANTTEGEKKSINQELWQACAGPLVKLPEAGTHVVYFPQGHSEQVAASMKKNVDGEIPNYPNLPSKLTCLLHNVTLHADPETDEVYAQMTLQPVPSFDKEALLRSDISMKTNRPQTEFFCKTLTASDTSTHGGFSVPRRAAEKIFHPLDFSLQPPAQELETRDLHDNVWRFRHIFRGQPKRHLLTTGWSLFVSGKRLFAGDSVLFIRDEKQHLLLGIRRANRQPTNLSSSVLSSDSMHIGILAAAAHASANNSPFTVFYNPRASLSEFVIPLAKYYRAACSNQISLGMRFRMIFETEESGTRRYMGTITGITDLDPVRWKNSQWRNLQVGWDESIAGGKRNRVSIWEIEPVTAPFFICPTPFFRPKRPRQPGMQDDDSSDLENLFKRTTMPWFDDDLGMMKDSHSNPGLSLMQWMNMQQNSSPANSMQPSYLNSLSGSVLQNFGGGVTAQLSLPSNLPQQNNLQFNQNTTQIQKPLQQIHIDQIQKLPAVPALNPLSSMINQVPPQMLQSQCQSLVQNNIILQPQPPSISNHQLHRNISCNFQPQQNLDPLSQQLQTSDNQIQFQLLQKLQQQQQVILAQQQSSVQQQSQLPQFHDHQSKFVEIPQSSSSHSVSQQPMPKRDNCQQIVRFSNPPPQQQNRFPGPLTDVNEIPGHLPTNNYFSAVGSSLLTGAVGGGQSVITDDVPSCSTSTSTNNCPNNRTQQQTTHFSATLFGSSGWDSISANNSSVKDVKQNPDIKSSTNILNKSLNQEFLAPLTYTNVGGGHIDYLDTSSATSVCLSQNDLNLQQNNTTMAYNNTQIMLCRDASQDKETLAAGFETNIETQMGMPMILNPLLPTTVDGSNKEFFNNLSNYDGAKDLQQELSSKMVSQFGVPYMSFNSLDSSINDSSFLNSWVPRPQLQRMRTYTKVYKRGAVGRSIDIGRYSNYEELKQDLARRFGIEGQLEDRHRVGWKLVYVDHENEVLLVGDDPWEEFVNCVRCIKILSPQEVQQMSLEGNFGTNNLPNF